jgi:flavin reductase (DIM6/NTAB) family NADH-FMN oxidoreductase RutF
MVKFTRSDIEKMHRPSRLHLINAIGGAKPVNLVGTIDAKGNENLAVFSSVVHFPAIHPSSVSFCARVLSRIAIHGVTFRPQVLSLLIWSTAASTGKLMLHLPGIRPLYLNLVLSV